MKFRKREKILQREKAALGKGEKNTLIQEEGHPSRKLNIKIFSASKYTPAYSPLDHARINYSETDDHLVGFTIQTEERQPVTPENELENWQKIISTADLSVRATNVLLKIFSSYDKFLASDENSLRGLRNCGRKTVMELIEFRNAIAQRKPSQPGAEVPIRPKAAEEALRLPLSEENILFLPIFSAKPVADFAVHNLHSDFYGSALLKDFMFSVRASKILNRLGLKTIGEVMLFPSGELLSQKNFGRKCLREVQDIIRSFILAGGILQPTANVSGASERPSAIDFSSYENLVASFARNCLKNKRNQAIVCCRLDFRGAMPTLEQLGERFGLTRERVRQILKRGNAFLRVKAHRMLLKDFWELSSEIIHEGGGVISLHDLSISLQRKYNWPEFPNPAALAELLSVAEGEETFPVLEDRVTVSSPCLSCVAPREFLPTLDFEANKSYHLLVAGEKLIRVCQARCQTASRLQKFHKAFIEKMVADSGGAYRLHGELIFPHNRWLIRHGERLEDLIVHVLEKHGKPMHFSEIAAAIRKENTKHREITDHNVHAAMMRYATIEIFQRGTYGLKAWGASGYRSVSTAIEDLLNTHDLPMRRSEIIKHLGGEFSEQNISAALHTWGSRFVSIGEGFYDRSEGWRKRTVTGLIDLLPEPLADLTRYITTNNNCSYKLVLALVFIRGMDDKGGFYLPTLKERFYSFYLGRHRKGEVVEAEQVTMRRIGELDAAEIRNKASKEPLKSFLASGFWSQKKSSMSLQEDLAAILADPMIHSLLLIALLKGIDEYFTAITPQPVSKWPGVLVEVQTREPYRSALDDSEGVMNPHDEGTISISIKKKSRGKIAL